MPKKIKKIKPPICKHCYGKGYHSELKAGLHIAADFIGDKEFNGPTELKFNWCSCERGKALRDYLEGKLVRALAKMECTSSARECRHILKDVILDI